MNGRVLKARLRGKTSRLGVEPLPSCRLGSRGVQLAGPFIGAEVCWQQGQLGRGTEGFRAPLLVGQLATGDPMAERWFCCASAREASLVHLIPGGCAVLTSQLQASC